MFNRFSQVLYVEALPLLEANVNESYIMRYKLTSLPKGAKRIPVMTGIPGTVDFTAAGAHEIFVPQTLPMGANDQMGYTAVLTNSIVGILEVQQTAQVQPPSVPVSVNSNTQVQSITKDVLIYS